MAKAVPELQRRVDPAVVVLELVRLGRPEPEQVESMPVARGTTTVSTHGLAEAAEARCLPEQMRAHLQRVRVVQVS